MNARSNAVPRFIFSALCGWIAVVCGGLQAQDSSAMLTVSTLAGGAPLQRDGIGDAAGFNEPGGIAVDRLGNVYVSDTDRDMGFGNTIRKITPSGVVTTLAGVQGRMGMQDGPGGSALFSVPESLADDQVGNIFVADSHNHAVRMISPDNRVSTLGSGFTYAIGIAVDRAGNVYVGDTYNHVIRKITLQREIQIVAGALGSAGSTDGTPAAARFNFPGGVALDEAGNIFVADMGNFAIRKVTPDGVVTTLAGTPGVQGNADGQGGQARFARVSGVAVDRAGNVYVTDTTNHTLRKVAPSGNVTTVAGRSGHASYVDGSSDVARFNFPVGIAVDAKGAVYLADMGNHRVRVATPAAAPMNEVKPTADSRVSNVSIRALVAREAPLIADFTVGPDSPGNLLIRAVGPSLSDYGIANALADPKLTLFDARGVRVAENDDFSAAAAEIFARAGAFPLRPGAKDAALVTTLPPGSYTARVEGDAVGSVLLEIFDAEGGTPQMLNLTTRGTIASGGDSVITGITVSPGTGTRRLLIRAIGPTLTSFGPAESEVLPNPRIEVYAGSDQVAENDNWSETSTEPYHYPFSLTDAFAKSAAFTLPLSSRDAALVHEFGPGSYTVVIRNQGEGRGNVMVEVLPLPPPPPSTFFPAGVLGLVDFTVSVRKVGELYEYYPRVRVKEIGGVWSAFIGELLWRAEYDGGEEILPRWNLQRRVQVASSVEFPETFSPYAGRPFQSPREFTRFWVRIPYSDDDLAGLTIEAVARVIR